MQQITQPKILECKNWELGFHEFPNVLEKIVATFLSWVNNTDIFLNNDFLGESTIFCKAFVGLYEKYWYTEIKNLCLMNFLLFETLYG